MDEEERNLVVEGEDVGDAEEYENEDECEAEKEEKLRKEAEPMDRAKGEFLRRKAEPMAGKKGSSFVCVLFLYLSFFSVF